MGSSRPRKPPKPHTVHTRDPRYNIPQYRRGSGEVNSQRVLSHVPSKPVRPATPNKPVDVLYSQLLLMDPMFLHIYDCSRGLIRMDDRTLRLPVRGRGNALNVDIKYNAGTDLYDVTAYEIKRDMSVYKVYEEEGFYTENLPDVLNRVILRRDFPMRELVQKGFKP